MVRRFPTGPDLGASPSGKAVDFDSTIRRFESSRPSQDLANKIRRLRDLSAFHSDAQKSYPTDAAVDASWTRSIAPAICSLSEFTASTPTLSADAVFSGRLFRCGHRLVCFAACSASAANVRLSLRRAKYGVHACSRSPVQRQETVFGSHEPSMSPRSTARKLDGLIDGVLSSHQPRAEHDQADAMLRNNRVKEFSTWSEDRFVSLRERPTSLHMKDPQ